MSTPTQSTSLGKTAALGVVSLVVMVMIAVGGGAD